MVLVTDCIACQYGDHDRHYEVIQAVPEGMIGGMVCACKGECRDRANEPVEVVGADPVPDGFDFPRASATDEKQERSA